MVNCREYFNANIFRRLLNSCTFSADDFSTQGYGGDSFTLAGSNAIIPKENCNKFLQLPFVKCYEKDVCAVASWDSSIHDNMYLNRLTPSRNKELVLYILLQNYRLLNNHDDG